jgi:hypothetical protein
MTLIVNEFDELIHKYLSSHHKRDDSKFSVNGDKHLLAHIFEMCGYRMVLEHLAKVVTDDIQYDGFSLDDRVATVGLILQELLNHLKNIPHPFGFEQKVGKLIRLLGRTHNIRFVRHKKVPHR